MGGRVGSILAADDDGVDDDDGADGVDDDDDLVRGGVLEGDRYDAMILLTSPLKITNTVLRCE